MHRRHFLRALGLTAGSLFLPSWSSQASAGTPPRRLLVFVTPHGAVYPTWRMRPPGVGDDTDFQLDLDTLDADQFSETLLPLFGWRDRVSVVDGLALVTAHLEAGSPHELGMVHAMTGHNARIVGGQPVGAHISLDQAVARHLARPDHFGSLELSVGTVGAGLVSFAADGLALPFEGDPGAAWRRLFGAASTDPRDPGASALAAQQPSILDAVAGRYARIARRLSASDADKLDRHARLVRDLEQRLEAVRSTACPAAGLPDAPPPEQTFDEDVFDAQLHNLTAAFSCDLTRVVTLAAAQMRTTDFGLPPGSFHNDYAHDVLHGTAGQADIMTAYTARHAEHFARILELLDSVPEGGGTLLDHTTVLWVSELANSAHGLDQWPVVVAGGDAIASGRYVRYRRTTPISDANATWGGPHAQMGVPHQRFLRTLLQGLGVPGSFGLASATTRDGRALDLTQVLPELL